jgi:thiol-disulfide isomerase/thioredoxin
MADGRARKAYLIPDSSLYNSPEFQGFEFGDLTVSYSSIKGIFEPVFDLKKGQVEEVLISGPTFFSTYGTRFMVYPGEKILVSFRDSNVWFTALNRGGKRNRELAFFNAERKLYKEKPVLKLEHPTLDAILQVEQSLEAWLSSRQKRYETSFDSLLKASRVSRRFRKLVQDDPKDFQNDWTFSFYMIHKDTLAAHGLFREKCMEMLSRYSDYRSRSFEGRGHMIEELGKALMPHKLVYMDTLEEFTQNFDAIEEGAKGFSRDYLLSRLLYTAGKRRIEVPDSYWQRYWAVSRDKDLKRIIQNMRVMQREAEAKANRVSSNGLLFPTGRKVTSLENVLAGHRGKVILLDFWTSWCAPCLEDIPHLDTLRSRFSGSDVVIVKVSLDRETHRWKKAVLTGRQGTKDHYLMISSEKSAFVRQYGIDGIPRYMLIDREGKVVNPDAPGPGEAELAAMIEKLVGR